MNLPKLNDITYTKKDLVPWAWEEVKCKVVYVQTYLNDSGEIEAWIYVKALDKGVAGSNRKFRLHQIKSDLEMKLDKLLEE